MNKDEAEICIRQYGRDLYSFCRYLTKSGSEADDLYQDTFLKAMELPVPLNMDANPKSYLLAIAVGLWKNKRKKMIRRQRIAAVRPMGEAEEEYLADEAARNPEQELLMKEQIRAVRRAVEALTDRSRPVVLLYYMEDRSVEDIARILRIPKGTVKSRLHQARKALKKELEGVL